jgi:O-antigen ligase
MRTALRDQLRSRRPADSALLVVPLYAAVVVAAAVRVSLWILLVPVLVAVLVLSGGLARRTGPRLWRRLHVLPPGLRWVPFAWLLLVFASNQKFSARSLAGDSVTRSGGFSIENVIELGLYASLAAVMLLRWPSGVVVRRPLPWLVLLAWPVWAMLTAGWSPKALYSGIRGAELIVPVVFAVFTARRLQGSRDDGTALMTLFARIYVDVCTCLAVFALVAPPSSVAQGSRLAWYGVHPLVAAEILAAALLVLVVGGRQLIGAAFLTWGGRLGIVAIAFARTQGRTSIVAVVLAVVVVLWVAGRGKPLQRWLGIVYYVGLIAGGIIVFSQQLLVAATRGEGVERLMTLDTRIPLWHYAISQLKGVGEIFFGHGFGTSGLLLSGQFAFAGQAHNSYIEAILGGGLVGVTLLVAWLVVIGRRLGSPAWTSRLPRRVHALLVGLFGVLLVLSIGSPELALPGFSWSLVCFLSAFVLRDPLDQRDVSARERSRAASRATASRSTATRSMTSGAVDDRSAAARSIRA